MKRRALLLPSVTSIATTDEIEMRKVLLCYRQLICLGYSIAQGKRSFSHHRWGGVLHASFSGGRSSVPGTGSEKRPGALSLRRGSGRQWGGCPRAGVRGAV